MAEENIHKASRPGNGGGAIEDVQREPGSEPRQLADVFLDRFAGLMDHQSVKSILAEQEHMLETLEIANEKLSGLNTLSEGNFQSMSQEFRQNTQILAGVKRELDSVFRRIRSLKIRLAAQYPEAYANAEGRYSLHAEDDNG